MAGIKRNLKQTLEIRDNASDPKIKLQAVAIANNCYKLILDMSTNVNQCWHCFRHFQVRYPKDREQLNTLQKLDDRIESAAGEQEHEEEAPTTIKEIF